MIVTLRRGFHSIICGQITGQEPPPQENGEVSPEAEFVPRKCDLITIGGRAEKCELAKAALLVGTFLLHVCFLPLPHSFPQRQTRFLRQALVPITEDVEVSYELHRYIIGQKGSGIRKMMEEYEVSSHSLVPSSGQETFHTAATVT